MAKRIVIALIVLWVCLVALFAVSSFRQFQISRLQQRELRAYHLLSQVDDVFTQVRDSLAREITLTEQKLQAMPPAFPFPDPERNWLFLRLAFAILLLLTGAFLWFYYRRQARS